VPRIVALIIVCGNTGASANTGARLHWFLSAQAVFKDRALIKKIILVKNGANQLNMQIKYQNPLIELER